MPSIAPTGSSSNPSQPPNGDIQAEKALEKQMLQAVQAAMQHEAEAAEWAQKLPAVQRSIGATNAAFQSDKTNMPTTQSQNAVPASQISSSPEWNSNNPQLGDVVIKNYEKFDRSKDSTTIIIDPDKNGKQYAYVVVVNSFGRSGHNNDYALPGVSANAKLITGQTGGSDKNAGIYEVVDGAEVTVQQPKTKSGEVINGGMQTFVIYSDSPIEKIQGESLDPMLKTSGAPQFIPKPQENNNLILYFDDEGGKPNREANGVDSKLLAQSSFAFDFGSDDQIFGFTAPSQIPEFTANGAYMEIKFQNDVVEPPKTDSDWLDVTAEKLKLEPGNSRFEFLIKDKDYYVSYDSISDKFKAYLKTSSGVDQLVDPDVQVNSFNSVNNYLEIRGIGGISSGNALYIGGNTDSSGAPQFVQASHNLNNPTEDLDIENNNVRILQIAERVTGALLKNASDTREGV